MWERACSGMNGRQFTMFHDYWIIIHHYSLLFRACDWFRIFGHFVRSAGSRFPLNLRGQRPDDIGCVYWPGSARTSVQQIPPTVTLKWSIVLEPVWDLFFGWINADFLEVNTFSMKSNSSECSLRTEKILLSVKFKSRQNFWFLSNSANS